MVTKFLGAIAVIFIVILSIFVILTINSEDTVDNSLSDVEKFVGKWRLIQSGSETSEDNTPGTSEESDTYADYETYEYLSNGTYYHVVDTDNTSGVWEINNSMLVLTFDDPLGVLSITYDFVFSDDGHQVTMNVVEDPETQLEFEKISS